MAGPSASRATSSATIRTTRGARRILPSNRSTPRPPKSLPHTPTLTPRPELLPRVPRRIHDQLVPRDVLPPVHFEILVLPRRRAILNAEASLRELRRHSAVGDGNAV